MGGRVTTADDVRQRLAEAGWCGPGVTVSMYVRVAEVALEFGEGHELRVVFDFENGSWRPDGLWLFGDKSQPCPLPEGVGLNVTRDQANAAARHLPVMLVMRAQICRLVYKLEAAHKSVDIRALVERVYGQEYWNRQRLFQVTAWLMAEYWNVGDVVLTAQTSEADLVLAVKHALRQNVTSFMDVRAANLAQARREDD